MFCTIFVQFFHLLIDLLFVPFFFVLMISWRSVVMFSAFRHQWNRHDNTDSKYTSFRRKNVITQFMLLFLDVPAFIAFVVLTVTIWRLPQVSFHFVEIFRVICATTIFLFFLLSFSSIPSTATREPLFCAVTASMCLKSVLQKLPHLVPEETYSTNRAQGV